MFTALLFMTLFALQYLTDDTNSFIPCIFFTLTAAKQRFIVFRTTTITFLFYSPIICS